MKRLLLLICSLIWIAACSSAVQTDEGPESPVLPMQTNDANAPITPAQAPNESPPATSFAAEIELAFTPLQMNPLNKERPSRQWLLAGELPLGNVLDQPATLVLFGEDDQEISDTSPLHAMIRHNDDYYVLPYELLGIPSIENSSLFLLNYSFSERYLLVGGLELYANGPGLVGYVVYDIANGQWLTFDRWGKPQIIDLDSDGKEDFIIQFEGLHLSFPDLTIYAWSGEDIQESESVQVAVTGISKGYALLGSERKIEIGTLESETHALYVYREGKLIRISS
ncbi:hypothetical protein [Paenibacillus sp. NPDC058071]|uniref:hypothetical protein n=1 Tax=Paenibacillus sp. NPDC058071 TaxID=3346326 RepID=UPI0036DF5F66